MVLQTQHIPPQNCQAPPYTNTDKPNLYVKHDYATPCIISQYHLWVKYGSLYQRLPPIVKEIN